MQKFKQNFTKLKLLHRNMTAEFFLQHTRRGILTLGIFLHFPHYQKSGNLQLFWLAHLILLATKDTIFCCYQYWLVDDTHFFYYYQTCHWDDIHNDKEEQDYAIFSTSQKNFPTFSEQIPTKCKPIHLLSSWFDKLSVSVRVTKPKSTHRIQCYRTNHKN